MRDSKEVTVVEATDGFTTMAGMVEAAGAMVVVVATAHLEKKAARAV
jgi:hypothetical protein